MDIRGNLASLCRCCHTAVHADRILAEELQRIIAKREGVPWLVIEESVWFFRRLPKDATDEQISAALKQLESVQVRMLVKNALEEMGL